MLDCSLARALLFQNLFRFFFFYFIIAAVAAYSSQLYLRCLACISPSVVLGAAMETYKTTCRFKC